MWDSFKVRYFSLCIPLLYTAIHHHHHHRHKQNYQYKLGCDCSPEVKWCGLIRSVHTEVEVNVLINIPQIFLAHFHCVPLLGIIADSVTSCQRLNKFPQWEGCEVELFQNPMVHLHRAELKIWMACRNISRRDHRSVFQCGGSSVFRRKKAVKDDVTLECMLLPQYVIYFFVKQEVWMDNAVVFKLFSLNKLLIQAQLSIIPDSSVDRLGFFIWDKRIRVCWIIILLLKMKQSCVKYGQVVRSETVI